MPDGQRRRQEDEERPEPGNHELRDPDDDEPGDIPTPFPSDDDDDEDDEAGGGFSR